jgi:hypothetical protein
LITRTVLSAGTVMDSTSGRDGRRAQHAAAGERHLPAALAGLVRRSPSRSSAAARRRRPPATIAVIR